MKQPENASPNTDSGHEEASRHSVPIYEVDFGAEGKGRFVRLSDFNSVANLAPDDEERSILRKHGMPESWRGALRSLRRLKAPEVKQ